MKEAVLPGGRRERPVTRGDGPPSRARRASRVRQEWRDGRRRAPRVRRE
ncbi:Hypothetical protein AA314_06890 [Archangium gephyra]|uniref:Uncharacterized protein n=1 Tax=Archangium gephyra TaxID=48 RepID=A0AAC8QD35_9BACT|nr:Hypothetical protein AA314_06890 [Archangium gephyra]